MPIFRIVQKHDSAVEWALQNPVLLQAEMGYELDTHRVKFGDGQTRWNDLPYFLDDEVLIGLIQQVIQNAGGDSGIAQQALTEHIASLTPHPVYDDMQSLVGLYQNAKV